MTERAFGLRSLGGKHNAGVPSKRTRGPGLELGCGLDNGLRSQRLWCRIVDPVGLFDALIGRAKLRPSAPPLEGFFLTPRCQSQAPHAFCSIEFPKWNADTVPVSSILRIALHHRFAQMSVAQTISAASTM